MSKNQEVTLVRGDQKDAADRLFRNFIIVLAIAFIAEVVMRVNPSLLAGGEERRWLEWLLVSLMGVCTYLLWNIAIWYHREGANFIAYRPWYTATAARGPILALVVMVALTSINFQVALPVSEQAGSPTTFDFGINFMQATEGVLLVVAFLLGFYSRLAKDILANIARFIFRDIFDRVYPEDDITKTEDDS